MNIQSTFTQDQIKFLSERLFDVMAEDFDYKLKPSKRKALLAKVMGSPNFDSLLQRSKTLPEDTQILDPHYRWFNLIFIDGEERYMPAGDSRYDGSRLSDLIFDSPEQANDLQYLEERGFSEEDLDGLILFEVTLTNAAEPFFSTASILANQDPNGDILVATGTYEEGSRVPSSLELHVRSGKSGGEEKFERRDMHLNRGWADEI